MHSGKNCCRSCLVDYPNWAKRQSNKAASSFHKRSKQICACCTVAVTDLSTVAAAPAAPAPAAPAAPPPPPPPLPLNLGVIMQTIRHMETKVATLEAKIEDSDEAMQRMQYNMKDKDDYVAVLELRVETTERAISDLELLNHAKTDAQERYVATLELRVKTMEQAISDLQLLNHAKTDAKTDAQERHEDDYINVQVPQDDGAFIKWTDEPLVDICKVSIADDAYDDDTRLPHDTGRMFYTEDIRWGPR